MDQLLERTASDIAAAHDRLRYTLGWRLLYTPKTSLTQRPKLLVALLNPQGKEERKGDSTYRGMLSVELGNAFRVEHWSANGNSFNPLQLRMQKLFKSIGNYVGQPWQELMDQTPTTNFCPFRTEGDSLTVTGGPVDQKKLALAFCSAMWRQILEQVHPDTIVTLSAVAFAGFNDVYSLLGYRTASLDEKIHVPGTSTWVRFRMLCRPGTAGDMAIVQLPHPSRHFHNIIGTADKHREAVFRQSVEQIGSRMLAW
jgi:hypothetical protein